MSDANTVGNMTGSSESLDNRPNNKFLCGVVEGKEFKMVPVFGKMPIRLNVVFLTSRLNFHNTLQPWQII